MAGGEHTELCGGRLPTAATKGSLLQGADREGVRAGQVGAIAAHRAPLGQGLACSRRSARHCQGPDPPHGCLAPP